MKQTAVEWLYDRFLFAGYAVNSEWKEQAKAMHKEEMIEVFHAGMYCGDESPNSGIAEEYYNERFNTKEK